MINLKDIYFGCSDANTEAERNPSVFREVFFDPNGYLDELLRGYKFILRGRKGDGKTAYGAQIHLISSEQNIHSYQRSLENFNNATFLKIKTYDGIGGNPYISFWKCVILIECVRMLYEYNPNISTDEFASIIYELNRLGFLSKDNDISMTITKLVETNLTLNIKNLVQYGKKYNRNEELRGAEEIYLAVKRSIQNIYLNDRFIFIIDGFDDILDSSEFKPEIITGLIRAADEINKVFRKTTLSIKVILLVRDDILNLCRDPNLSKILRDSCIRLSWEISENPFDSNLIRLVEKRIDAATHTENSFQQMWREIFPEIIHTRKSMDYILENIIYRPRDILQLFQEIQKVFIPGKQLTSDRITTALVKYSDDYFVEAMRDELTGFFPDNAVTVLPEILSRIGNRVFYLSDFEAECSHYLEFENVSARAVLERLFSYGYIGQHRPRGGMDYTVFSYRNSREVFQSKDQCVLHRGLTRALKI